jgi:putative exosortase-associated protein (TIGR04073 family)
MPDHRRILGPVVLALALLLPAGAHAEESYGLRFLNKAQHGLGNMALGWQEMGKNVVNISAENGFACGVTFGVIRGAAHVVGRTVVGAVEFITSPIPTDEFVTPPYIWERPSEDTRYFGLHLPGEWTHFGPLDDGGMGR